MVISQKNAIKSYFSDIISLWKIFISEKYYSQLNNSSQNFIRNL